MRANAEIRGKQDDMRPVQSDGAGGKSLGHVVSLKREGASDYPAGSLIET